MSIAPIKNLATEDIQELVELSLQEGFRFLKRLVDEWETNKNRFDKEHETLYKITFNDLIIGIGGINNNPYDDDEKVGRLRRFYIHPNFRRKGIGSQLVQRIITDHKNYYKKLTLRTDTKKASTFYEDRGFSKVEHSLINTHEMILDKRTVP